jgi:hypothetical protein
MKIILFLSHANPEDNDFVLWLASRLRLAGYEVWCDIEGLLGGELTWDEIDDLIRNKSIKFLLIVSKNLCKEPGKLRKGVADEFRLAESLAKEMTGDFVIPLKIDNVPYNYFIGLNTYNNISFYNNWAEGLKKLIKKLGKDGVPKQSNPDNRAFANWYENEYTTKHGIIDKKETYYSNWWEIQKLPKYFYIYQYENYEQAKRVFHENKAYPMILTGNSVVTFCEEITEPTYQTNLDDYTIKHLERYDIEIQKVVDGAYKSDVFPTLLDSQNRLKWLLNETFAKLMRDQYLNYHEMSRHARSYYFLKTYKDKVSFTYKGKKKTKQLSGRYFTDNFWHAAISGRAQLTPILGYSLKIHILFSNNGVDIWSSKSQLHSARRKKGKRWFNQEWREILFAIINALKDENGKIEVDLTPSFVLELPDTPFSFTSEQGYIEPQKDRQDVLQNDDRDSDGPEENTE